MYYQLYNQLNSIIRHKNARKVINKCFKKLDRIENTVVERANTFHIYETPTPIVFDFATHYPSMNSIIFKEPKYNMIKKYVVNEHIDVCLIMVETGPIIQKKTMIYIDGKPFNQCMYLAICKVQATTENVPETYNGDISRIDDYIQKLPFEGRAHERDKSVIDEDDAFWGHCSNIQAWVELDYNPEAMASNISFNLLKKLSEVGDLKAKRVLESEIRERMMSGCENVVITLFESYSGDIPLDVLVACVEKYPKGSGARILIERAIHAITHFSIEHAMPSAEPDHWDFDYMLYRLGT